MDMGLIDLPQTKWGSGTGRQVILKGDFAKIEAAVLQSFGLQGVPTITWVDATSIKAAATPNDIASVMMCGFPSVLHPGRFVSGGLTDGRYRENTADVVMDFDLATNLWGSEKSNQLYVIFAIAGNADTAFSLKAMPWMRVKSQTSQTISLGTLMTPSSGIGYGITTDGLAGGALYVISGVSQGLIRSITGNNNNNTDGGTITYGGTALTMAQGDWFIVLPPNNFRMIGTIFNTSAGNIEPFIKTGNRVQSMTAYSHYQAAAGVHEDIGFGCPLATEMDVMMSSPGAEGDESYIGHPDTTQANGAAIIKNATASDRAYIRVPIRLCKAYISANASWATWYPVAYYYPPGCGY